MTMSRKTYPTLSLTTPQALAPDQRPKRLSLAGTLARAKLGCCGATARPGNPGPSPEDWLLKRGAYARQQGYPLRKETCFNHCSALLSRGLLPAVRRLSSSESMSSVLKRPLRAVYWRLGSAESTSSTDCAPPPAANARSTACPPKASASAAALPSNILACAWVPNGPSHPLLTRAFSSTAYRQIHHKLTWILYLFYFHTQAIASGCIDFLPNQLIGFASHNHKSCTRCVHNQITS